MRKVISVSIVLFLVWIFVFWTFGKGSVLDSRPNTVKRTANECNEGISGHNWMKLRGCQKADVNEDANRGKAQMR